MNSEKIGTKLNIKCPKRNFNLNIATDNKERNKSKIKKAGPWRT